MGRLANVPVMIVEVLTAVVLPRSSDIARHDTGEAVCNLRRDVADAHYRQPSATDRVLQPREVLTHVKASIFKTKRETISRGSRLRLAARHARSRHDARPESSRPVTDCEP